MPGSTGFGGSGSKGLGHERIFGRLGGVPEPQIRSLPSPPPNRNATTSDGKS